MFNAAVTPSLKWYSMTRRRLRGSAVILGALSLALIVVAYYFPFRWYLGPVRISLRSSRNPATVLALCTFIWYMTSHSNYARLLAFRDASVRVWNHSSRGRRVVLVALVANFVLAVVALVQYPYHLVDVYKWYVVSRDCPALVDLRVRNSFILNFAERCKAELPADARILYHGHIEGMEFAYEMYPRRVFMLPGELYGIAGSWHKQSWLAGMPDDPLELYWHRDFPTETTDPETFIREHGITHEVFFDGEDWFACRWQPVSAANSHEEAFDSRDETLPSRQAARSRGETAAR